MIRRLARLTIWLIGLRYRRQARRSVTTIVISAPPDARMALLKTRYARHTPIPGRDRPLRLDELTRLMRWVRAEHQEEHKDA